MVHFLILNSRSDTETEQDDGLDFTFRVVLLNLPDHGRPDNFNAHGYQVHRWVLLEIIQTEWVEKFWTGSINFNLIDKREIYKSSLSKPDWLDLYLRNKNSIKGAMNLDVKDTFLMPIYLV